jgi:hypothetical protein
MTWDDDEQLDTLRWHWDSAYLISHPSADLWLAQRRDDREMLRAITPSGLQDRIMADYLVHPVSVRVERSGVQSGARGTRFLS